MFCYIANLTSIKINVINDLCEIMIAWNWKYCDKTFFFLLDEKIILLLN